MYVYKPGSGFSGPSVKVKPGFELQEVAELTQNLSFSCDATEHECGNQSDVFQMSQVSSVVSSVESDIVQPTQIKRYILVVSNTFVMFLCDLRNIFVIKS